eukprot:TRINITY_DN22531_c0_g1_i6.p1 TRINITY_DN22531_c0_g1~~TRINITY_DN22531_c0_g1_i6.p1  ORF type:complete len:302 (-),score=34.61 TRINITY_DN22531_c0_g1_i6:27-932(-)
MHRTETAPYCSLQLGMRSANAAPLTLSDFALMSSLTYETRWDNIHFGLQHYFPGWHIEYKYNPDSSGNDFSNWAAFFQLTDPSNSTSVFVVRGSVSAIDALNDVDIYLCSAMLQLLALAAPGVSIVWAQGIVRLTNFLGSTLLRRWNLMTFANLLSVALHRIKASPQRRFFITGHSLGGGLAKLVSAKVEQDMGSKLLPAIAFASPGIWLTSAALFGESLGGKGSITVIPDGDVVSRVDFQSGAVVQIPCKGSPLHCHFISTSVCSILEECGITTREDLSLPCGYCPGMPCDEPSFPGQNT